MRVLALTALIATLSGCFGYNSGAKKWAYVGDAVMIAGGGAAIASDQLTPNEPCPTSSGNGCYQPKFGGGTVAGVILVSAGIVGILINATRPTVKTSR